MLRKFDDIPTEPGTHSPEFMAHLENCAVVKGGIPAGTVADPLHTHRFDQFYFILAGTVDVQLGSERLRAGSDTLVRIPAGVPHFALNNGPDEVVQIEILAPAPVPASGGQLIPIKQLVDELGGPPPPSCLKPLADNGWTEIPDRPIAVQVLANRASGSRHAMIAVVRMASSVEPAQYSIHPFDEYYFVLDGAMTVDVAGETFHAGRHDLVVVPARTPYRTWNAGDRPERHLTIAAPEPPPSLELSQWTVAVEFSRS
ncbi:cupin domain-containing protein [Mycobacterium saskatchewanense]|uniref:Cupin type-2 domain-containing protein n=1 Tax=Mycobacterium saskatchewanense TaxID=220927 RepID=A0AAJ3NTF4_9MYCO|nr:cupin domain-containing protein [Mycobacterium saskatchewanense]ORW73692.1 hypothetical protein AWC23_06275 [Mycobacterium saskatchewanense]